MIEFQKIFVLSNVSGCVAKGAEACNENGIYAFFPILRGVTGLEDAMHIENAMANMEDTVEQIFRLIKNISRKSDIEK